MISTKARPVFLFLLVLVFAVLLIGGFLINHNKPPIPRSVEKPDGAVVYTGDDIIEGQNYYFSRGGQHIGSIWGHGSYLAPDWSADYLHRTGVYLAARHAGRSPEEAADFGQKDFDALDKPTRAMLSALVTSEIKQNRFDPASGRVVFSH